MPPWGGLGGLLGRRGASGSRKRENAKIFEKRRKIDDCCFSGPSQDGPGARTQDNFRGVLASGARICCNLRGVLASGAGFWLRERESGVFFERFRSPKRDSVVIYKGF